MTVSVHRISNESRRYEVFTNNDHLNLGLLIIKDYSQYYPSIYIRHILLKPGQKKVSQIFHILEYEPSEPLKVAGLRNMTPSLPSSGQKMSLLLKIKTLKS